MRIERVEEPTVWLHLGHLRPARRRSYVEFTLVPTGGGTRLTVVESGFAQLPEDSYRKAFEANTDGWASELGELVEYLDANAA